MIHEYIGGLGGVFSTLVGCYEYIGGLGGVQYIGEML